MLASTRPSPSHAAFEKFVLPDVGSGQSQAIRLGRQSGSTGAEGPWSFEAFALYSRWPEWLMRIALAHRVPSELWSRMLASAGVKYLSGEDRDTALIDVALNALERRTAADEPRPFFGPDLLNALACYASNETIAGRAFALLEPGEARLETLIHSTPHRSLRLQAVEQIAQRHDAVNLTMCLLERYEMGADPVELLPVRRTVERVPLLCGQCDGSGRRPQRGGNYMLAGDAFSGAVLGAGGCAACAGTGFSSSGVQVRRMYNALLDRLASAGERFGVVV